MGIEKTHAYRFVYLKSEQWRTVRIEALARESAKCQICGLEDIHNDAHHVWYPKNIYETKSEQLVILCRPCHDLVHTLIPECKTKIESQGWELWNKFSGALKSWRISHLHYFGDSQGVKIISPRELRNHVDYLKGELQSLRENGTASDMSSLKLLDKLRTKIENHLALKGFIGDR